MSFGEKMYSALGRTTGVRARRRRVQVRQRTTDVLRLLSGHTSRRWPARNRHLQRELIVDNTRDGARGRASAMTPAKLARARELLDTHRLDKHQADGRRLTMDEIARTVGVSRRTLYRALDQDAAVDTSTS